MASGFAEANYSGDDDSASVDDASDTPATVAGVKERSYGGPSSGPVAKATYTEPSAQSDTSDTSNADAIGVAGDPVYDAAQNANDAVSSSGVDEASTVKEAAPQGNGPAPTPKPGPKLPSLPISSGTASKLGTALKFVAWTIAGVAVGHVAFRVFGKGST